MNSIYFQWKQFRLDIQLLVIVLEYNSKLNSVLTSHYKGRHIVAFFSIELTLSLFFKRKQLLIPNLVLELRENIDTQ